MMNRTPGQILSELLQGKATANEFKEATEKDFKESGVITEVKFSGPLFEDEESTSE